MITLEAFFIYSFILQLLHSTEELSTGFHKKWYLFKMPFKVFLLWEIAFSVFWASVFLIKNFPLRENLLAFFLALMFANGVQHVVWALSVKKYVPGLITAAMHIVVFLVFYLRLV